jgi:hypothetical protein
LFSNSAHHAGTNDTKTSHHQTKDRVLQSATAFTCILRFFAASGPWQQTDAL